MIGSEQKGDLEGLGDFLDRAERRSKIQAAFDAGSEVGIQPKDLILEEELEVEVQEIIETAQEAGLTGYSREDAIRALMQEEIHKQS